MKRISLLILTILFTGCQSVPAEAPTQMTTNVIATIAYPTITSPTDTLEIKATEVNPYLQVQCLSVQDALPPGFSSDGILVMQNIKENHQISEVYGLDLHNNNRFQVNQPWEDILEGEASPDGKWIFYKRYIWDDLQKKYTKIEIVVASLEGQLLQLTPEVVLPDNPDWFFPNNYRWISNDQLLVRIPDPSSQNVVASTVLVWNPFTNEKKIIRPEFPDVYEISGAINPSWGYGVVLYNPMLTRAFYLTGSGVTSVGYQLWDMEKGESIATFELYNDTDIPPRWSPDGSRLALVDGQGDGEISIIEADGKISQLTHVGDSLKYWEIQNLNWSPYGQYIAFSLWSKLSDSDRKADKKIATLAIADIKTGKVVDTCIPIGNDYGVRNLDIFWSPTDKQLVVKDESAHDYNNPNSYNRLILVDLEQGVAAQVAEYMEPFGWMIPQE
jgi:Tol biopolymer transport system component